MSIQQLTGFTLAGLRLPHKTTNKNEQAMQDCGHLWTRFGQENVRERLKDRLSDEVYAVYFDYDGDYSMPYAYFIGCKVPEGTALPHGLDLLHVPAQAVMSVPVSGKMPQCVADAWRNIWATEYPRAYGFDYEVYDERSQHWDSAELDIFLSVK